MPLGNAFLGILIKDLIGTGYVHRHPAGLGTSHQMGKFRRYRQIRIDSAGMGMQQIGPARIPNPQMASAVFAKVAFGRA